MENEPPEHTRLRRLVTGAFARGHVERLRPRVRQLAASLLDEVDENGFDVIGAYAEPLPVLVISELSGCRATWLPSCAAGRRQSCGCTRSLPSEAVVDAAVGAARDFADAVRAVAEDRARALAMTSSATSWRPATGAHG